MNKRGSDNFQMFVMAMLFLSFIVGVAIFNGIQNLVNDATFWRNFYTRDLALAVDTALVGRGDIEFYYSMPNIPPHTVTLEEYVVIKKDSSDSGFSRYPVGKNVEIPISPSSVQSHFMIIDSDETISLISEEGFQSCPTFRTFNANPSIYTNNPELKYEFNAGENSNDLKVLTTSASFQIAFNHESDELAKLACILRKELIDKYESLNDIKVSKPESHIRIVDSDLDLNTIQISYPYRAEYDLAIINGVSDFYE